MVKRLKKTSTDRMKMNTLITDDQEIDYLSRLPKELKLLVLTYLTPIDLNKLSLQSHLWYESVNEDQVWKQICLRYNIQSNHKLVNETTPIGIYLNKINQYKRAYLIDYNVNKNWCSRKLSKPVILRKHDEVISCLKFDDQFRILIGSYYLRLELWCLLSGKILQTFVGHTDIIWTCQLTHNKAVSASADQTVRVWNIETGDCLFVLNGHQSTVRCLSTIVNNLIISGSSDNSVRLWNIKTGECNRILEGHKKDVSCVCFDGSYIISGSYDFNVRVWNINENKCLHVLKGHVNRIFSLLFNGDHVISGSLDSNIIIVWNVKTGNCLHKLAGFHSLQMRISNDLLVTSSFEPSLKIWSLKSDKCIQKIVEKKKEMSCICCFEFNDNFLVSYSLDGYVKLWCMKTFKFIRNLLKIGAGAVWDICLYKTKLLCILGNFISYAFSFSL